jgi:hypothetical protein
MTPWWRRTLGVAAGLLLAPLADRAAACSCMSSGPPCQAAWTADVVFAGKVRAIDPVQDNPGLSPLRVTFDVERGFINAPPAVAEVTTGAGGGDCGYRFVVGKRYLVYARRSPSGLTAGICSRTRPIEAAGEDIKYLSSIPAKGAGGRVYGRIREWRRDPAEEHGVDYGPLEGITVSVQGPTMVTDVITDANGRFEVTNLPVGKATVKVQAPFGFDGRYLSHEIEIPDLRACSVQDFTLERRASASGTVVDASGRPLANVIVDAVAAELAGFDPPPHQAQVTTNERGTFAFDSLPPGTYVFGVNLTTRVGVPRSGASVFLPGVPAARDAKVIELKAGDDTVVGVLRLRPR